jgi:hypothetical protein
LVEQAVLMVMHCSCAAGMEAALCLLHDGGMSQQQQARQTGDAGEQQQQQQQQQQREVVVEWVNQKAESGLPYDLVVYERPVANAQSSSSSSSGSSSSNSSSD